MLGEQDARLVEIRPFPLHGITYYDVTVRLGDRSTLSARLGPESVPEGVKVGDELHAMVAANMLVSLRRP